jgi:hypothetical protein
VRHLDGVRPSLADAANEVALATAQLKEARRRQDEALTAHSEAARGVGAAEVRLTDALDTLAEATR